ncbi:MAG: urease accessory protein UreD [Treponema sp.]|jgi:urease accessory protein|nr:urease accessory protein UreD [Treponema sp.]
MSDCFFTSPFKVAKPFYRDDGYTEIMVMCASPGILAGDKYDMRFNLSDNTKTIISEQSYRKLYNSGDDFSQQYTKIQAGENAALYYVPYPVIPFAGSRFRSQTDIDLRLSSKLIFGEIFTCGRDGMGERFAFSEFSSRTTISIDGKPVFLDNSRLFGSGGVAKGYETEDCCADFSGPGFFEGYSCQGVFFIYGFDEVSLSECEGIQAAVSKSSAGFTVRALAASANNLCRFAGNFFRFC